MDESGARAREGEGGVPDPGPHPLDLSAAQRRTLDGLIATPGTTAFAPGLAQGLRDRIEEAIRALEPQAPLRLGKSTLNDHDRCEGLFAAVLGGERAPFSFSARFASGRLLHKAVELEVAGREDRDPHTLVAQAAERLSEDDAFAAYWRDLDGLRQDELLMDAAKVLELFRSSMPPLRRMRRELTPATEWHIRSELAGGALTLSGTVDLVLGAPSTLEPGRASRLAIDLKTGRAWAEHAEDMRFYALLLTLRFGVPPYRVATLYLESGEWQAEDVEERTLERAADRVIDAARTGASQQSGGAPELRPGPYCTWCPRAQSCPRSAALAG